MLKKLRWKFILVIMTIITVMMIIIFTLISYSMHLSYINNSKRALRQAASRQTAEEYSAAFSENRQETPSQNGQTAPSQKAQTDTGVHVKISLLSLNSGYHIDTFSVTARENGTFVSVGRAGYFDLSDTDFLREIHTRASEEGTSHGELSDWNLRFLIPADRFSGTIYFADISGERTMLMHLTRTFLILALPVWILILLISILLTHWAVRPVDLAWKMQKQFIADASHELKTPLTVILTNAEMLESGEFPPDRQKVFADNILAMSHQMRGLVEGMLELARIDTAPRRQSMKLLSLSETVTDALLPFEPVYFEKHLSLESSITEGLYCKGNPQELTQLTGILLDNAAKYTPGGGSIRVLLTKERHWLILSVSNTGAALSDEVLENIFRRFYRLDKTRSMNYSYGLGLAIAEDITRMHKGKIRAMSVNGWNTFEVRLQASDAPSGQGGM